MERDEGLGGRSATRSRQVVPQHHDGQDADDAGDDDGGFQETAADIPESDAFVLPLDDRIQRDRGADNGDRKDHLG